MKRVLIAHAFIVMLACLARPAFALPCFPGAEGFGTSTPGGRGGRVIVVTSLDDDGPGSLRAACVAKGPRTVAFAVGGTIRLQSTLRITEPFITIAGQSAPGKGICLRDAGVSIETHDVVMRFVRVRVGPSLAEPFDEQNCLEVSGEGSYNVVVDHCSFSWGLDENVGIVSGAHDCTFSYNIVSEPLRQPFTATKIGKERSHSMALILGNHPDRCSIHHNLIAHANSRNPRIQGGTHDFVNNVVYDWGFLMATFSRNPSVNFVRNHYKPGPSSKPMEMIVAGDDIGQVYVEGNSALKLAGGAGSEWDALTTADPSHQADGPFATAPIAVQSASDAYAMVVRQAGCRLPVVDEVDARVIRQTHLGMGGKIDRPWEVGGYPGMPVVRGPVDSDADGMPDAYEVRSGLDPRDAADASGDANEDGYTNLEDYLNFLVEEGLRDEPSVVALPVGRGSDDSPYTVVVNGTPVPVSRSEANGEVYLARFAFSGTVRATVECGGDAGPVELEPARYRDNVATGDDSVSFDVFQPGPRIILPKAGTPLVVIADALRPEPARGDFGYHDVSHEALGPKVDSTRKLQAALGVCSARGGGLVYFGPGIYRAHGLSIGDNTTVYLAPGAVVRAEGGPAFVFRGCRSAELRGPGVIECAIPRPADGAIERSAVELAGCKSVGVEDVLILASGAGAVEAVASERVFVRNVHAFADCPEGTAVLCDSSRDVCVTGCTIISGGRGAAVAATLNGAATQGAVRNAEVRDCVLMTSGAPLRIADPKRAEISDVLFQDCDAVACLRGIELESAEGRRVWGITLRDVRLDVRESEPIIVRASGGVKPGAVSDVLFDRLTCTASRPAVFEGVPDARLEHFDFWGCRFIVTPGRDDLARSAVIALRNARGFTFKYAYLHWQGEDSSRWNGFIGQENVENVLVRELEETHD